MKNLLFIEIIIACVVGGLLYWLCAEPDMKTVYQSPKPASIPQVEQTIPPCVNIINERNNHLQSIISDLNITIYEKIAHRATATLAYQKNQRFRMTTYSMMGLESDVGSNDAYFWFWSKRMNPPVLFYARHENLFLTGLKTPFNPQWMMESLGINIIETKNMTFEVRGNTVAVKHLLLSPLREPISKITLIDSGSNLIIGHYLYLENIFIASTEIIEFNYNLPKKMQILWHEEKVRMIWEFKNTRTNININPQLWQMPINYPRSQELGLTYQGTVE
jgi:hypothetical protein